MPFLPALVFARLLVQDPVDAIVHEFMLKEQVPGAAVAVVYQGKVLFQRGYGVTDLQTKTPVTPKTVFPLASLSKPFVAMAVLKLVEQKKVDLAAPIGNYLTDIPALWKPIHVRHLLDHTS